MNLPNILYLTPKWIEQQLGRAPEYKKRIQITYELIIEAKKTNAFNITHQSLAGNRILHHQLYNP